MLGSNSNFERFDQYLELSTPTSQPVVP